jgi:hypothetical protein
LDLALFLIGLHLEYSFSDKVALDNVFLMSFNRELIERMKRYSLSRFGEEISDETAIEHLDALADFYEAFSGLVQNKK